ncbi:MAG TPA: FecR domain-containing protein [Bacteroidales bacterium]|nr:FecR domain-containing protein [Bacteroidales bacterium]
MNIVDISEKNQEAIIDYFSGKLTAEQAEELLQWVNQNEENRKHFRQMYEIWNATSSLNEKKFETANALKSLRNKIEERDIRKLPGKVFYISASSLVRAAAVILLIVSSVITGLLLSRRNTPGTAVAKLIETSAPKGSKTKVVLIDGTEIWLNADTKLRYPVDYGTGNRDIYLEGEAYFKVAHNKNLPFRVITTELSVTALGTAFNVKAYDDEETIETTLEEGQVRIDNLLGKNKDIQPVILQKSQNAIYHRKAGSINVAENVSAPNQTKPKNEEIKPVPVDVSTVSDIRLFTSWKDRSWVFRNEKLSTLAPKLERRYNIRIIFEDSTLKEIPFTGVLEEDPLEQVLKCISESAPPIKYSVNSDEVTFSKGQE